MPCACSLFPDTAARGCWARDRDRRCVSPASALRRSAAKPGTGLPHSSPPARAASRTGRGRSARMVRRRPRLWRRVQALPGLVSPTCCRQRAPPSRRGRTAARSHDAKPSLPCRPPPSAPAEVGDCSSSGLILSVRMSATEQRERAWVAYRRAVDCHRRHRVVGDLHPLVCRPRSIVRFLPRIHRGACAHTMAPHFHDGFAAGAQPRRVHDSAGATSGPRRRRLLRARPRPLQHVCHADDSDNGDTLRQQCAHLRRHRHVDSFSAAGRSGASGLGSPWP